MPFKRLHIQSYRSWRIDDTTPKEAFEHLEKLERHQPLQRAYQIPESVALEISGGSRSNCHRWRYKNHRHSTQPGERIQIDPMTVHLSGGAYMKAFKAVCPASKRMVSRVCRYATFRSAKRFLEILLQEFPMPVLSMPADGGSEFRGELDDAQ